MDWDDICALMANRLIPFDKCPGVRPIGVGECQRRVLGKTMSMATGSDVVDICGIDQLASGLRLVLKAAFMPCRTFMKRMQAVGGASFW